MGASNSLETLFSKMENFVTSKTVVGDIIHVGDVIILPLVDVVFGVGAGGGGDKNIDDKKDKSTENAGAGGGGLGAKLTPSAVIVVVDGNVQLINLKNQDGLSKLIDMTPGIMNKLNLNSLFGKDDNTNDKKEKTREVRKTESHFYEDGEDVVVTTETISEEMFEDDEGDEE